MILKNKKRTFVSFILPVFNEDRSLYKLYTLLKDCIKRNKYNYEIIFIDDRSTDDSFKNLLSISKKDKRVKIIRFIRNFGQTASIQAGFDFASGDIIIVLDSDGQNDPNDIERLILKINDGFDVVSGWRKNRKDKLFSKIILSYFGNKLISTFTGVYLNDYGCSLKAYKKTVVKKIKIYGEMHRFLPIYASWQGANITEIEVRHHPREHGESNYNSNRIVKVILDLIMILFLERFLNKPLHFFGTIGIILLFGSILTTLWAIYLKIFNGVSFISTPVPLLIILFFVSGLISILLGILAEVIIRIYYESQNKSSYIIDTKLNIES